MIALKTAAEWSLQWRDYQTKPWCPCGWANTAEPIIGLVMRRMRAWIQDCIDTNPDDVRAELRIAAWRSYEKFDRRKSIDSTYLGMVMIRHLRKMARTRFRQRRRDDIHRSQRIQEYRNDFGNCESDCTSDST